jgi:hypothetical protein
MPENECSVKRGYNAPTIEKIAFVDAGRVDITRGDV